MIKRNLSDLDRIAAEIELESVIGQKDPIPCPNCPASFFWLDEFDAHVAECGDSFGA